MLGDVAQWQEASDLESEQCGFESLRRYMMNISRASAAAVGIAGIALSGALLWESVSFAVSPRPVVSTTPNGIATGEPTPQGTSRPQPWRTRTAGPQPMPSVRYSEHAVQQRCAPSEQNK